MKTILTLFFLSFNLQFKNNEDGARSSLIHPLRDRLLSDRLPHLPQRERVESGCPIERKESHAARSFVAIDR